MATTEPSKHRISPILLGVFLILFSGFISVKIVQPWLATQVAGSAPSQVGWIAVNLFRLLGLVGYGLFVYGCIRGIVRLFHRHT